MGTILGVCGLKSTTGTCGTLTILSLPPGHRRTMWLWGVSAQAALKKVPLSNLAWVSECSRVHCRGFVLQQILHVACLLLQYCNSRAPAACDLQYPKLRQQHSAGKRSTACISVCVRASVLRTVIYTPVQQCAVPVLSVIHTLSSLLPGHLCIAGSWAWLCVHMYVHNHQQYVQCNESIQYLNDLRWACMRHSHHVLCVSTSDNRGPL